MSEPIRELCDSAKKGRVCIDDICHACDVTLCGFDKEAHEQIMREFDEENEIDDFDDDDDGEPPVDCQMTPDCPWLLAQEVKE